MSKAFVAASEDATVGRNQKSNDFKAKFFLCYCKIIADYNKSFGTSYSVWNAKSIWNRFRKISRLVLKLVGTVESVGDPPSGDTDCEEYDKQLKLTYIGCQPEAKNIYDNVLVSMEFLKDKPKWKRYQQKEDEAAAASKKKAEWPEGT